MHDPVVRNFVHKRLYQRDGDRGYQEKRYRAEHGNSLSTRWRARKGTHNNNHNHNNQSDGEYRQGV